METPSGGGWDFAAASPAAPPSLMKENGALTDTLALIEDITALFETQEDVSQVEALAASFGRLEQMSSARRSELARQLHECEQSLQVARDAAAAVESEEEHVQRMRNLEAEKAEIIQQILELGENAAASRVTLAELKSEMLSQANAQESGRSQFESELVQREKKLDLFVRISNICFDVSAPGQSVRGFVSDQPHRRVYAFDFPRFVPDPSSDVEMANHLWDLIDRATA